MISCLSFPSTEIEEESNVKRSYAIRMGRCPFDEVLRRNCYSCARLYDSVVLYRDCCYGVDSVCSTGV
ncbi:hypothetical protein DPMN_094335 [Dreissena polymorpha]|uniref:Uncharacterized protein n=1 Tax=Dreissena polymorpha TaxID=45954 RepID=A0A9D4R2L0_DREPO|nr:hypothetical protein DPMN_094335 [Dreissena polymorpha]